MSVQTPLMAIGRERLNHVHVIPNRRVARLRNSTLREIPDNDEKEERGTGIVPGVPEGVPVIRKCFVY